MSVFLLTFGDKLRVCASREAAQRLPDEVNLDRNLTGATIGYNVTVANNSLRYNLRLP